MRGSILISLFAIISTAAAQFDPQQCGPAAGNQNCPGTTCCSQYGWCGTGGTYCEAKNVSCPMSFFVSTLKGKRLTFGRDVKLGLVVVRAWFHQRSPSPPPTHLVQLAHRLTSAELATVVKYAL
jgi:hypothetical protein